VARSDEFDVPYVVRARIVKPGGGTSQVALETSAGAKPFYR
jgi:hypothetical protein